MQLTMQDYGVVGVHSMEDRKRILFLTQDCRDSFNVSFQLIQSLKSEVPNGEVKRISNLTSRTRISDTKPSSATDSSAPTRVQSAETDLDIKRPLSKHMRSLGDLDEYQDEGIQQFRKIARSQPALIGSPRSSKKNLNAYGIPVSQSIQSQVKGKASVDLADRIRVCVRKRPLSKKEIKRGESDIAQVTGRRSIGILEPK
jgi:kinesin family protein 2/24